MTDRVGQQLGNYRLVRILGRGGFAEVYLGEHIHLETQAAVKVLHTQVGSNELELFRKEARTIARLEHPRIVRVLEFGVEKNSPYLVMTYAPNGTLRQRYPKGEQLPLNVILSYVEQVAEALQYIHDQKLIQRDVKPENLLLDSSDNILLSDFGIASVAHTTVSLTSQGQAGTPHYLAPEQIMNKPGPASDQYALGVVVYEWLAGIRPFQGDVFNIFFQQLQTPPLALRKRLSTIPPLVEVVVLKALAKDPKQRFASVKAFANALKQASNTEQVTPSVVPATSIAPDFTTHMAEVDTKSGQILPRTQPVPPIDQHSLSFRVAIPDIQLQTVNDIAHPLSSTIPPSRIMPLPNQPPLSTSSHQQVTTLASVSQSRGIHLPKQILLRLYIPVGIFLIFLAFAFYFSNTFRSDLFLPIFFAGLAFASLFSAASPDNLKGIYVGLYPFVCLLGLALCFLIGFWPWIFGIPGISLIIYFLQKI
ncbi:MAG TPA: serine/threonine-protein kinase [Ktedonobacteraceae bacterium]